MGKHLEPAAKELIVTMSENNMRTSQISAVTQVALRTVQTIILHPERHRRGPHTETRGRPRALNLHAINVPFLHNKSPLDFTNNSYM
jgi:transposase